MKTTRFRLVLRWSLLWYLAAAAVCQSLSAAPAQMPGYEIVYLGRGHLNRLLVAASIEGKKGLFVVDTGAGSTFVGAGKYSFLRPGPDRQLPAGVPGTANINGVTVPVGYARSFQVKNTDLGSLAVSVVPQRYLYDPEMLYQTDKNPDYDGYLGEDILRHCSAILDAARLILYLNVDPSHRTDPGRGLVAAGWTRVPMTDQKREFIVECTLRGTKFRLIVDTGSPFTFFDKRALDRAQVQAIDIPMRSGLVGARQREMSLVNGERLAVGTYAVANFQIVAQAGLGDALHSNYHEDAPVAGLLGGDFLAKNNAIIDIGNKALYLKPPASAAKKP